MGENRTGPWAGAVPRSGGHLVAIPSWWVRLGFREAAAERELEGVPGIAAMVPPAHVFDFYFLNTKFSVHFNTETHCARGLPHPHHTGQT